MGARTDSVLYLKESRVFLAWLFLGDDNQKILDSNEKAPESSGAFSQIGSDFGLTLSRGYDKIMMK